MGARFIARSPGKRWPTVALTAVSATVCCLLTVPAAPPAAAAEGAAWGYALVDPAGAATGDNFSADGELQDTSTGDLVTADKLGTGSYEVRFAGLGTAAPGLGVAHVTATTELRDCQLSDTYAIQAPDVVVGVACRDAAGSPADAAFSVVYSASTAPASAGTPGAFAYLLADQPTAAAYNPATAFTTGDSAQITKLDTGSWTVQLAGSAFGAEGGNVQVTAFGGAARCAVAGWQPAPGGPAAQQISVQCKDLAGNPADAKFTLTYAKDRSILGTATDRYAYVRSDQPATSAYSYNSTNAVNAVTANGSGAYGVQLPLAKGGGPYVVLASPISPDGNACTAGGSAWDFPPGSPSTASGQVKCFQGGSAKDTAFSLTFLSSRAFNPLDDSFVDSPVALSGVLTDRFNPLSAPLVFTLPVDDSWNDDNAAVSLKINETVQPASKLSIAGNRLTASGVLVNGRNSIDLAATDTLGRPVSYTGSVWAGSNTIRVYVADFAGNLVTGDVTVRITAVDDQATWIEAHTTTGIVDFPNLAPTTLMYEALASGNRVGSIGGMGTDPYAIVYVRPFDAASTVNNNDFSQGGAGWNLGNAPVALLQHVEGDYPAAASAAGKLASLRADDRRAAKPGRTPVPLPAKPKLGKGFAPNADNDLMLYTYGQGEWTISRTFRTQPGMTDVRIRYRFITNEVPGGYFGSQYNDYFKVRLRSQNGGGNESEKNSMNGLGLAAFNPANGATRWRDVRLPVASNGDTVQVEISVANVADPFYDSAVVVDFVQEAVDQVRPQLVWNNRQGGIDLRYTVEGGALQQNTTINVYFARGPSFEQRVDGDPIIALTVPAGTAAGTYTQRITGDLLADDPPNVTHIIAAAGPRRVAALRDVVITYGANARQGVTDVRLLDIVMDAMRAAGQSTAQISSTVRGAADQARAMFNNLTATANIQANIDTQLGIYGAAGDAVINVFAGRARGLIRDQIVAQRASIQADMLAEINRQGCRNVTRHCDDPALISVIDMPSGLFVANGTLFTNAVTRRLNPRRVDAQRRRDQYIDERRTNGCYHFQYLRNR